VAKDNVVEPHIAGRTNAKPAWTSTARASDYMPFQTISLVFMAQVAIKTEAKWLASTDMHIDERSCNQPFRTCHNATAKIL